MTLCISRRTWCTHTENYDRTDSKYALTDGKVEKLCTAGTSTTPKQSDARDRFGRFVFIFNTTLF